VKGAGGFNIDNPIGMVTDNLGNIYLTGNFFDRIYFDQVVLISPEKIDLFLAKYDNSGNLLWVQNASGAGNKVPEAMAMDRLGNIVITGYFLGNANFNGKLLRGIGDFDIFVAKYDAHGNLLWVKKAGWRLGDMGFGIATDYDGNIYVVGSFELMSIFDSDTLHSNGLRDFFIAKYDPNGFLIWVKSGGGPKGDDAKSIAVDDFGNFVITGNFSGQVDFGARTLSSIDFMDAFIAGYDVSGNNLWAINAGASRIGFGTNVALDRVGNSVVTGSFLWFAVFGNDTLFSTTFDSLDIFVAKFDKQGQPLWARSGGSPGDDRGTTIVIDDSGNVTIGGYIGNSATFDRLKVVNSGNITAFITKYNKDGEVRWVKAIESTSSWLGDIDIDVLGNYLITGGFNNTAKFDTFRLQSTGLSDIFVGKLTTNALPEDEIVLSVSQSQAFPRDTVLIDLQVYLTTDSVFNSFEIDLQGFQKSLDFLKVITDNRLIGETGWNYEVNPTDSLLAIAAAGANEISGEGLLLSLEFRVRDEATGFIPVKIKSAIFNTGTVPVKSFDGGVEILLRPAHGDVDENGQIQAFDASLILKYLVGILAFTPQQKINADVTLDQSISTLDASLILQFVVGLIDTLPFTPPTNIVMASAEITMPEVSIQSGRMVEVPIQYDNSKNLLGFDGVISFDPKNLELKEINWPDSIVDFAFRENPENGLLHFAAIGELPQNGALATLKFQIKEHFEGETTISLKQLRLNEGPIQENVAETVISNIPVSTGEENDTIPSRTDLHQNYPNPFNPETTIEYELARPGHVRLTIYNLLGQRIQTLVDEWQPAGKYRVKWDGRGERGAKSVASGVYVVELKDGEKMQRRKLLVIR
ncbi:MAG: T9SS C-terminal target domain-containing protein, partial [Calditrichaeota bacterium]